MKKQFLTILALLIFSSLQAQNATHNLVVGTYTTKCESKGIYVYNFNSDTGDFSYKNTTDNVINPSYLTVSKDNKFIYSVNEFGDKSSVSSFTYNSNSGEVLLVNSQKAMGADPCYIINDDKNVIVANYSGGNIAVFKKENDGSLAAASQVIQHYGKSVNAKRQEAPHAHMVLFSPDKKFVLAVDLGNDKVYCYAYNANSENEVLKMVDTISVKSGSGPRHLTFSEDGKMVYLLQELDGSLTVFRFSDGKLKKLQENTIIDKGFKGAIGAAAIQISPDGQFLYASNRGEANTISLFKILKNGKLESKGQISTLGKGPRNFVIDPTGKFLLVAHQYSNTIVIFKRDLLTGSLIDTGKRVELCAPVCMVFTEK
jgi:6-phosphogluconolactonase